MADPSKEERLAAALRENLRKRKAQERAIEQTQQPDPPDAHRRSG